jgi:hypothetical protein
MIYKTSNPFQKNQAIERFNYLIAKEKTIELTVKHPKRSISQNSYLHLILTWFGLELGYTMEEVKLEIFKKLVNPNMFYEGEFDGKLGLKIERWRSTASLNKEEMTLAVTRFRNFSSKEVGIYLPEPKDLALLQELENEIKKRQNQEFL